MARTTTALIIIAAVVLIATTVAQIQTRVSSSTPEIAGLSAKNIVNASNNLHNRVYSLLLNGDKIETPSPKLAEAVAGVGIISGILSSDVYTAIIIMVALTTIVTPLWLKRAYKNSSEIPPSSLSANKAL